MIEKDATQISIFLTSLHIERTLAMFIEFYYRPQNVKPFMDKLGFHQVIEVSKELKILQRTHWYGYFEDLKSLRNKVAHRLDYWELLNKDEVENQKAKDIIKKCEEFRQIPILDMISSEVHPIVTENAGKMFGEALIAIARISDILPDILRKWNNRFTSK